MSPPGYWMNETSGVLEPVVRKYLAGYELDPDEVRTMRAYLRQWVWADGFLGPDIDGYGSASTTSTAPATSAPGSAARSTPGSIRCETSPATSESSRRERSIPLDASDPSAPATSPSAPITARQRPSPPVTWLASASGTTGSPPDERRPA